MVASGGISQAERPWTLPDDRARAIMWRFTGRADIAALIRSIRAVARGPVARLVAEGGRTSHEWTGQKGRLLEAFDAAGITRLSLDPSAGGLIDGPKNLVLAIAALELAWVDAGAATTSLAHHLALAPFRERGTAEQRERYLSAAPGPLRHGAFVLTEPIPYAGVETGLLGGKVRVAAWEDATEPILQVDKRGRFITNMAFADFVVAAVESGDARIAGSCMVVLEHDDPGTFDRGEPTRKLVHQLSSTGDPVFSLRVPASRILGGYRVVDGAIVPNHGHAEILEAVFRRSRVTVGLMTSAKLLSAVEPILRYQRSRFRGARSVVPGTPLYELGLQQREDVLQRLVDVWATGEAGASLGFAAARLFDDLEALERRRAERLGERAQAAGQADAAIVQRRVQADAREWLRLCARPEALRDTTRYEALSSDEVVRCAVGEAVADVLGPACKLWNTGYGATMMREAVSLLGGYGITEQCPGFLGYKWMDAQLEATYEGPEAVQRRQLAVAMASDLFLAQFDAWIWEMRHLAVRRPGTGACTLASAMELWRWTLRHLREATDANGNKLYLGARHGVTFPLADALCWLLASRYQILDTLELEAASSRASEAAEDASGLFRFFTDLCHVQAARAGGEVGRIAADLVHGYNRHPAWDADGEARCYGEADLAALEQVIPGIESTAGAYGDIIALDGSHASKAGPCVPFKGLDDFIRLRSRLDGCLTGSRLAKDRAAVALTTVLIPDQPDYPPQGIE